MSEPLILFYDFETNGQTPFHHSAIMQMAILSMDRSIQKNIYVHPYDGIVGATEIHGIRSETLSENNAITSKMLMTYLVETFTSDTESRPIHWIAYNNFGFDQLVMEHHFRVHKMKTPSNWIFLDLFPLVSRYYPDIRKRRADGSGGGGYKLANVYATLCPGGSVTNWHTADADVEALHQIYQVTTPYHRYLTSNFTRSSMMSPHLLNDKISTLKGYAHYFDFQKVAITRIRHLYRVYLGTGTSSTPSSERLDAFLRDRVGIYSEFFRRQMVEQIEIIHQFQMGAS